VKLVLVDCLAYQGFLSFSGDTPHGGHLVTLRSDRSDQDEKRSLARRILSGGEAG
jgi:hypothetical protein